MRKRATHDMTNMHMTVGVRVLMAMLMSMLMLIMLMHVLIFTTAVVALAELVDMRRAFASERHLVNNVTLRVVIVPTVNMCRVCTCT